MSNAQCLVITEWLVTWWLVTGWLVPSWPVINCPVPGWPVPGWPLSGWLLTGWLAPGWPVTGDKWLVDLHFGCTQHPSIYHLDASTQGSIALEGGAPIKRIIITQMWIDSQSFLLVLSSLSSLIFLKSTFAVCLQGSRFLLTNLDNLEQEENFKQLWWLSHRAFMCPQSPWTIFMKSHEDSWYGQAINNNKKLKKNLHK